MVLGLEKTYHSKGICAGGTFPTAFKCPSVASTPIYFYFYFIIFIYYYFFFLIYYYFYFIFALNVNGNKQMLGVTVQVVGCKGPGLVRV